MSVGVHHFLAALAAFAAGGINSVAGGGTLITFPALLGVGIPAIAANTTSTVAIWPGTIGSMWGFRRELRLIPRWYLLLALPSIFGGLLGAWLLHHTSTAVFEHLVPFLILFATLLFSIQAPVQKRLRLHQSPGQPSALWMGGALFAQFSVGIYGGYFGAGMSIMMLTALAFMGMDNILEMSAVTSFLSFCTNGIASVLFIGTHMVVWSYVLAMMVAALLGGWSAAGLARRLGKVMIRRFVIFVGVTIGLILLVRSL